MSTISFLQWLVTKKAKEQWKNYKAMLEDAKARISSAEPSSSPQQFDNASGMHSKQYHFIKSCQLMSLYI